MFRRTNALTRPAGGAMSQRVRANSARRSSLRFVRALAFVLTVFFIASNVADQSTASFTSTSGGQISASAAIAFDPSGNPVVSNIKWWLDSSDSATLFADTNCTIPATVGGEVACWKDHKTTNTVVTPGTAPTLTNATVNGKNAIYFNNHHVLAGPDLFGGSEDSTTLFIVTREVVRVASAPISLNGSNFGGSNRFTMHLPWSTGIFYYDPGNTTDVRAYSSSGLTTVGQQTLAVGIQDPIAGHNYLRINGTHISQSTTTRAAQTVGGLRLGEVNTTTGENIEIAEVIIYDRTLTATEVAGVENYLKNKWGTP